MSLHDSHMDMISITAELSIIFILYIYIYFYFFLLYMYDCNIIYYFRCVEVLALHHLMCVEITGANP